jgi:hypothetical protein
MASVGDVPRVVPAEQRKPLWLFPNLLSLDAPLVAVVWLYMFAKTWRVVYLPWAAYIALGLVVWVIYTSDRLLDSSMAGEGGKLEARHEFHRRHRGILKKLLIAATFLAVVLVTVPLKISFFGNRFDLGLPVDIYWLAAIGGFLVAGFFTLSLFTTQVADEIPYAKNILAGIAFAYGTGMIVHVFTSFEFWYFLRSPELICFAVLCVLNISAIDLWEHANRFNDPEIKASDELALTLPLTLLGAAALVFALKDPDIITRPFFYAILTGAALLQILNRSRQRFSMDALRVLADVALLAPLLVFIVSSRQ